MTKKIIAPIITLAFIVVFAFALYFLNRPPALLEETQSEPMEIHFVLGGEIPLPVKKIRVSNDEGGFTLLVEECEKSPLGTVFVLVGYEDFPISVGVAASVANISSRLVARALIAQPGSELSIYGLDPPVAMADITLTSGDIVHFYIGAEAPGNAGHYVSNCSGAVYLVASYSVANFFNRPLDFMNRVIIPRSHDSVFTQATLGGSFRTEQIEITKLSESDANPLFTHRINRPFSAYLDPVSGMPLILSAFGLSAEKIVGTNTELETFGLDEPYSILELVPGQDAGVPAFTLSATRPDMYGRVYISSSLSKLIFRLPAHNVEWLEATAHDLMVRLAILPHIETVSRITVDTAAVKYIFDLGKSVDYNLLVTFDGMEIDPDVFRRFYRTLVSASFDFVAEEPLPENPDLLLRFTYEYNIPGKLPDVVSFYVGPARRAFIVLNDGQPFYTTTHYIDRVIRDVERIIADLQ